MTVRRFYMVDVFAEEKYAGNQLAVVRDSDGLSGDDMLRIAQEMNYAETTFILSEDVRAGGYDVRIFTPGVEVPFAGHPTLGTAYIIRNEIATDAPDKVVLNLKAGPIPVTFSADGVQWMRQNPPTFGDTFTTQAVADVLNISPDDIDARYPIQEVSTGLPFVITPLKTLAAMRSVRLDVDKLRALLQGWEALTIAAFCPETYHEENDLNVRVMVDVHNVFEDPATGSANGCLAGYLVKYRYFGTDKIDVRSEQGYEIRRRSLLRLRAAERGESIEVNVGGRVFMVAQGELV